MFIFPEFQALKSIPSTINRYFVGIKEVQFKYIETEATGVTKTKYNVCVYDHRMIISTTFLKQ